MDARNAQEAPDTVVAALHWIMQGSDTYVDTQATAERVVAAAQAQGIAGRVMAYSPAPLDLPAELRAERIPSASLAGPGEVIETLTDGEPVLVDRELDYLSHIRLLAVSNPAMCVEELGGAVTMVTSGRVDFVVVTPPRDADPTTRTAMARILDTYIAEGARLAALSPTGRLRRISGHFRPDRHVFTGEPLVLDCRGIRGRIVGALRRTSVHRTA